MVRHCVQEQPSSRMFPTVPVHDVGLVHLDVSVDKERRSVLVMTGFSSLVAGFAVSILALVTDNSLRRWKGAVDVCK